MIDAGDAEITEKIITRWKNGFQNPAIGRQLLRRIRQEGLSNTWVEGIILLADGLQAVDVVYDVMQTSHKLMADEKDLQNRLQEWIQNIKDRDQANGLTASVTLFLAGGQKIE